MRSVFFHADLDAFFASVEIADNPEYRGKPLIIGTPGERHVVSTCSYEARKFGVHSAMTMKKAIELCPCAITVEPRMGRYIERSKEVMDILSSFAPGFMRISIDEAFLDLSDMSKIYPIPGKAAGILKKEVFEKTGLTLSIGVATSRYIAKLASDYRKPDGLTVVPPGKEEEFTDAVGLEKLWGIGESTYSALLKSGVRTVKDLRNCSELKLESLFGPNNARFLKLISRGIDPGIYTGESKSESISSEKTFFPDIHDRKVISSFLLELSEELMIRSIEEKKIAGTVCVKIRYGDFTTITAQKTPYEGIYSSSDVYSIASELFDSRYNGGGIRLIGVSLMNLYDGENVAQADLFADTRKRDMDKTVANLRKKGSKLVKAGTLINKKTR